VPVVRQTRVSQDERDKYKAAAAIGVPGAALASLGQHQAVHAYGRKLGGGKYTRPKFWQFRELFDPRRTQIAGRRKLIGGAGWTASMVGSRIATPLAAGGIVGLASTRQQPRQATDRASLIDRAKAGTANALHSSRESAPKMDRGSQAAMLGATLGGSTVGGAAASLAADARLKRANPTRYRALAEGRALPRHRRALLGTAGAIAGSALGLKAVSGHIQRRNPDYRMTPFGPRYRERVAVGKVAGYPNMARWRIGPNAPVKKPRPPTPEGMTHSEARARNRALREKQHLEYLRTKKPLQYARETRTPSRWYELSGKRVPVSVSRAARFGVAPTAGVGILALNRKSDSGQRKRDAGLGAAGAAAAGSAYYGGAYGANRVFQRMANEDVAGADLKKHVARHYRQAGKPALLSRAHKEAFNQAYRTTPHHVRGAAGLRAGARIYGAGAIGRFQMSALGLGALGGVGASRALGRGREPASKSAAVTVMPTTAPERRAEAKRKRTQAALSTGAAVGTIGSLGLRGAGAGTAKWGARRLGAQRAKRIGDVLTARSWDASLTAGSVGAGSSLYFGRQQRREANELERMRRPRLVTPVTVTSKRITGAEFREHEIARRQEIAKALWRAPRVTPVGMARAPSPFKATTYQRRTPTGRLVSVARRGGIG
jgi:hypothetical protein